MVNAKPEACHGKRKNFSECWMRKRENHALP
jgi:hypothetical protein